jgi:hypothetical protein
LTTGPEIKCAVARNEADSRLTRATGNDDKLKEFASENCLRIGASHLFFIMMDFAFPINVLSALKSNSSVVNIYVASANPLEVIIAETRIENEEVKIEREERGM